MGNFGSFVVRVVEYTENAPVTDGTETDIAEGTRHRRNGDADKLYGR